MYPFSRMGIPDKFIEHGSVDELLAEIDLTAENIVRTMERSDTKEIR